MDIRPNSSHSHDSVESHYAQRPSFNSYGAGLPNSFLSDDDLCGTDEDDNQSVTSSSSSVWSNGSSPRNNSFEREREAKLQRDFEARQLQQAQLRRAKQELLRQKAMRERTNSSTRKKSKLAHIVE
jgi:hypothetical protein